MGFHIDQCADKQEHGGGSTTQRQFSCTPSFSEGSKQGIIKDRSGGTTLMQFTLAVISGAERPVPPVIF